MPAIGQKPNATALYWMLLAIDCGICSEQTIFFVNAIYEQSKENIL